MFTSILGDLWYSFAHCCTVRSEVFVRIPPPRPPRITLLDVGQADDISKIDKNSIKPSFLIAQVSIVEQDWHCLLGSHLLIFDSQTPTNMITEVVLKNIRMVMRGRRVSLLSDIITPDVWPVYTDEDIDKLIFRLQRELDIMVHLMSVSPLKQPIGEIEQSIQLPPQI